MAIRGRAATTDEAFLRALVRRARRGAAQLRHRLTGERASAEDIVQETLLGPGAAPASWRRPAPRPPLAVRRRRNLIIDRRRRGQRRDEVPEAELEHLGAVDELDRALDAWQMADALAALSPEHREVLVETYYRGRSVAEAAETIGVPPGTVKSRTYYALRSLRLRLEEGGWRDDRRMSRAPPTWGPTSSVPSSLASAPRSRPTFRSARPAATSWPRWPACRACWPG